MSGESKALIALLAREDMREKFAAAMSDLTANAFEKNHILETLDELCAISDSEQLYALDKGITSEWANRETFANSRQQIRDFADIREYVVFRNMYKLFEWEKNTYTVSVTGAGGAVTTLNTQKRNGRGILSAEYNCKCTVPLKAEIADGWEFVSWEINGVTYDTPEVELNARTAGTDGRIIAKLNTKLSETTDAPLQIKEISTAKKAGYIVLYNPNSTEVSTAGLYLTDKPEKLDRWEIPARSVPAYGELLIVTDNNKTESALHQLQANFSLKKGETLILSDKGGNILAEVPVPDIPEGSVYAFQDYGQYRAVPSAD